MTKFIALLALVPSFAFAGEVLVLATATRMDPTPLSARKGLELSNNGSANISCQLRTTTGLTTTVGRIVAPGESWAVGANTNTRVYCIAAAPQTTGAATIVTEVP